MKIIYGGKWHRYTIYRIDNFDDMCCITNLLHTTWCIGENKQFFEHYLKYNKYKCFYVIVCNHKVNDIANVFCFHLDNEKNEYFYCCDGLNEHYDSNDKHEWKQRGDFKDIISPMGFTLDKFYKSLERFETNKRVKKIRL